MKLVEHWRHLGSELPSDWNEARLALRIPREDERSRAAALLGPAGPGLAGEELRITISRSGGIGPENFEKLLRKIDAEGIAGTLTLVEAVERAPETEAPQGKLAEAWAEALAALPPDWSDLYAELELTSSDHLDRGALLIAPLNPVRMPGRNALRFRVAHSFGYGAAPQMVARCLARLDAEGIAGRLTILHALSDTHNVDTQGPVWRVGGKAV
jgi:hypothetical protein